MIYEFAVDPALFSRWNEIRYLQDKFGISEARLISRYPKRWCRMAYECISSDCLDRERKKIIECLSSFKKKALLTRESEWNPNRDWQENALAEHERNSFRAICANTTESAIEHVLPSAFDHNDHPLWKCPREIRVPRRAQELARLLHSLLSISKEILFIDPYFGPGKTKWIESLERFLSHAVLGKSPSRVEYHLKYVANMPENTIPFEERCQKNVCPILPKELEINFYLWSQRLNGLQLHPRYILTEKGGVRIDPGLDTGDPGEEAEVTLLTNDMYKTVWTDYQADTAAFDLKARYIVDNQNVEKVI